MLPESSQSSLTTDLKSNVTRDNFTVQIWFGILTIYMVLCTATGYFSFVKADQSPGYERYAEISKLEDKEAQEFLIEVLQKEESEHIERQSLASQSFHIVLGALLGFMSASAASLFRKKPQA